MSDPEIQQAAELLRASGYRVVGPKSPRGAERSARAASHSARGLAFAGWFSKEFREGTQHRWELENWARVYDDLVRIDGLDDRRIVAICQWARADEFWKVNFISPVKLRRKNPDREPYWKVFEEAMKARGHGGAKAKPVNYEGGF